jgi:superfamily II DNA or RNA helicase
MRNTPHFSPLPHHPRTFSLVLKEGEWQKLRGAPACGSCVRVRGRRGVVQGVARFGEQAIWTIGGFRTPPHAIRVVTPFDRLSVEGQARWRWKRTNAKSAAAHLSVAVCAASPLGRVATGKALALHGWQRVAARAFDEGRATRILLADGVGLGKTVQAGFAIASLLVRAPDARVLVATPAGLRDQWRDELARLFGIDAAVLDPPAVRALRRLRPRGAGAWSAHPIVITSIDYLKQAEACAGALQVAWDLFVADEAHALAPSTERHAAANAIARASRLVLLITATPHAGDDHAFTTLCRVGATGEGDPIVLVRRTRADVSVATRRRVRTRRIAGSLRERALHARLRAYAGRVWTRGTGDPASRLAMTLLLRRAASGARALVRSLEYRRHCLERGTMGSWVQPPLPFAEDGELDEADVALPAALAVPGLLDRGAEIAELRALVAEAEACAAGDSKLHRLVQIVRRVREPLVVFTEYRDTLQEAARVLDGECAIALLHGGVARAGRQEAERRFASGSARVLLATDVAAEGLNLHHASRAVVNVELPWSPARLEQRIGRVDRLGQPRIVHVSNMVWQTGVEDAVLRRLDVRLTSINAALPVHDALPVEGEAEGNGARLDAQAGSREYVVLPPMDHDDTEWLDRVRTLPSLRRSVPTAGHADAGNRFVDDRVPVARIRRSMILGKGRSGIALVFRARRMSSSGAVAADGVVAVFVARDREALDDFRLTSALNAAIGEAMPGVQAAAAAALERHVEHHYRRTHAQIDRVRALDASAVLRNLYDPLVQPGLFDRRALSNAARERAAREALERHRRDWIALLERDLELDLPTPPIPVAAFVVR